MTTSGNHSRPHHRRPSSTMPPHRIALRSLLTTTTILLLAFFVLFSTFMTPSTALPIALTRRRNPLTVGLGLGGHQSGGGIGINLGGGALLNLHHLHNREVVESPEIQAAQNEAIVSSFFQKRSELAAPAVGADADSSDADTGVGRNGERRHFGEPRRGDVHILPIAPGVFNKRQHMPGSSPGSGNGNGFNKNDPMDR